MIRVVVVEDEPVAARAHASYLERLEGFEVVGTAPSCAQALLMVTSQSPDLVLLDMRLPDGHGLELLHRMRAAGQLCDVIAVTSVRDVEVVRRAMALGVTDYLVKPFTFEAFARKLANHRAYRGRLERTVREGSGQHVGQGEIDQLLDLRAGAAEQSRPSGVSAETLVAVRRLVLPEARGWSASELAETLGTSRVTARRYLEHLATVGEVERRERHGQAGRPEVEYRPTSVPGG